MKHEPRKVTSGNKEAVYSCPMPENVADFVTMLATDSEEATITVNKSGLKALAVLALKAYLVEKDNAARLTLKETDSTPRKGKLSGFGF